MKYIVVLGDGMADHRQKQLNNQTPLEIAKTPMIDKLAKQSEVGLVHTVPKGMSPGSDTANLSILGYDPAIYYSGRSPLEAVSIRVPLENADITFRANLVTVTETNRLSQSTMVDHSSGEIDNLTAQRLINDLKIHLQQEGNQLYFGRSYRNIFLIKNTDVALTDIHTTPPHDILEKPVMDYYPQGKYAHLLARLMEKSYDFLRNHPLNIERKAKGLNPANSLWFWGEGRKPKLKNFTKKYGLTGSMVSAVDLLFGLGICAGLKPLEVEGATGTLHTNYAGKVKAALDALSSGDDFVYIHIEAPDECGHRQEYENKVKSIEYIDQRIILPIIEHFEATQEPFSLLLTPDHATPLELRTHTSEPVPYLLYRSTEKVKSTVRYTEFYAATTNQVIEQGHLLMDRFLQQS